MTNYAKGGYIGPTNGDYVPVQLLGGCGIMSAASLKALKPDMREILFGGSVVMTPEEALAELDDIE